MKRKWNRMKGTEHGLIKSVDPQSHCLVVTDRRDNTEHKFQWDDQTQFTERDKPLAATDLKEGMPVSVIYTLRSDMPMLKRVNAASGNSGPVANAPQVKPGLMLLNISILMLCSLVLGAAGALAADSPKAHTEQGLIKSVDAQHHWLLVTDRKDNSEHKYQWNDRTRFTERGRFKGDKRATPADLKEGMRVSVTYAPGDDTPTLKQVQVAPAKPERHARAHASAPHQN